MYVVCYPLIAGNALSNHLILLLVHQLPYLQCAYWCTMATSAATCGYCSELFTEPRMLPCLHTFCLPCLTKASEIQGAKEALQCPVCDEKAPLRDEGVHVFPKHLRKEYDVELARYRSKFDSEADVECDRCLRTNTGSAVAFCTNCCEFLCKLCREDHHSWKKTHNHEILAIGKQKRKEVSAISSIPPQPMPCPHHKDEVLKFFCMKCEKLICRDCRITKHKDHSDQCDLAEEVAKHEMEGLRACAEASQGAVAKLDGPLPSAGSCSRWNRGRRRWTTPSPGAWSRYARNCWLRTRRFAWENHEPWDTSQWDEASEGGSLTCIGHDLGGSVSHSRTATVH